MGAKAELVCATPMVPAPVCFYGADSEPKMNLNLPGSRRWRLHGPRRVDDVDAAVRESDGLVPRRRRRDGHRGAYFDGAPGVWYHDDLLRLLVLWVLPVVWWSMGDRKSSKRRAHRDRRGL